MDKIRVVIIEDEPAIARHLGFLLEQTNHVLLVQTLHSIKEAAGWLPQHTNDYDLIFMDIKLGDGISFAIFEQIDIKQPVVFVTAYNDYAVQAFKNNGIDYILKPFDEEDIMSSILKFKSKGSVVTTNTMHFLLESMPKPYKQSFLVHYKDKLLPIAVLKIAWFYTSYDMVYLSTTENNRYIIDFTLEQLERQLDPYFFFRANRQFIINRRAITEVGFYFNGRLSLKINPVPDSNVLISKARASLFKSWMQS